MNSKSLAQFIRSHGNPCRITKDGLRVASRYSDGRRCRWQVETIPASLMAARDWLGY